MLQVLLKAASFVFIIILAYVLKKAGVFGPKDYSIMVKVVLNVTLPAAVVCNFAATQLDLSMLVLVGFGIVSNCIMLALGLLFSRGAVKSKRALYAIAFPGYNIGAFSMPFAQSFLGPMGVASACLFDTGNAIMCTGGTYAVTDMLLNRQNQRENPVKMVLKRLSGSTPFLTYTLMLVLALLRIRIPMGIANFIQPIANANSYCAMFMIGLMFEIDPKREVLQQIGTVVLARNMAAVLLALGCYFLLPLPLEVRQSLAVISFAPPSALTPAFVERCGGDASTASCISSFCIVTALIFMSAALVIMNIT